MLAAGLALGVGLDGCALDDDQDYLRELRLAWTLANRPGAGSPSITAADTLHLGLAGGAAVTFGNEAPFGRLEAGAMADLVLIDWRAVQGIWASPLVAPAELLLRRGSKHHVRHVMVGGEWVLREGRATRVDEAAVHAEVRAELEHYVTQYGPGNTQHARALAPYIRQFYAGWDLSGTAGETRHADD
jgi:cytosine/adenosine deaminase-related metal-dependent hydrolase